MKHVKNTKNRALSLLSLFTSTGTLLCCALPTLLVTLGFGAAVASSVSAVPWLATLSRHKGWAFLVAGALMAGNWLLLARTRRVARACALPAAGESTDSACEVGNRFSRAMLLVSTGVYAVGFFVAYVAFPTGKALGLL